ncbi:hypothetical protein [Nocardia asteroides]|uniref:hypothetical protein n=1 Tax=Nocardia asteroides TaxID=1824 RepID=UPI00344665CE
MAVAKGDRGGGGRAGENYGDGRDHEEAMPSSGVSVAPVGGGAWIDGVCANSDVVQVVSSVGVL